MEYRNMDLIICVEYENANEASDKLLKIVINREYDREMINIFHFNNIPKEANDIYEYSKTVSKIVHDNDMYVIYGQRIHKNGNNYREILSHNTNPVGKENVEISAELLNHADIDYMNQDVQEYYNDILATIKWKQSQQ